MKIFTLLLLIACCTSSSNGQKPAAKIDVNQRVEKIINSQWTFNYFPVATADNGYESTGYNDSKWSALSLPHTWNTFETTGELFPFVMNVPEEDNPYWWTGWGWYRKHFSVNTNYSGKKVFIEFEGVQKYCKVWINGKYLGDHNGGFGSFDFDLTPHIKPGGDNVIAVAVNNRRNDRVKIPATASGDFNGYGGICRNVKIVIKNNLYIPMQGSATHEGGTFISTPVVTEKTAVIRVQTWVKNDNPQKKNCTLQTSVFDAAKHLVQVIRTSAQINPGQLYKFDQSSQPVKNPHLWSNEDPYLYKVISEVFDGKDVVDSYTSPLGFRWFRWDYKENVLYVNGKKIAIHGGTRDKDYPWLGDAIPEWITVKDYTGMAENLKYNFIRTNIYPDGKIVFDLTDRYGIITNEELTGIMNQDFSASEQEQQLKEMIRRDRNHPGIILWGAGDESKVLKSVMAEDSTRIIASQIILNAVYRDNKIVSVDQTKAGQAAKIILTGSHKKISADRGSVVSVSADIVDNEGKHIQAKDITLKWILSGPAILVGPAIHKPDLNLPFSNFIRSTGKPGKIHLSVLASGLISGGFDIVAEETVPDNSVITEPVLQDDGRIPVAKLVLNANRLDEIPKEINPCTEDIVFGASDKKGYKKLMSEYILKHNPKVDTVSVEFRTLTEILVFQLINSGGNLSTDDFNFNIEHFNNCRLIDSYISSTKLPLMFKDGLRKYYADAVILKGQEKNAGEEMNWLNWIPSGGTVIFSNDGGKILPLKGAVLTDKIELSDMIAVVYPGFVNFSAEAKERALEFITKMNPYVHSNVISEQSTGVNSEKNTKISYKAEKGKPVLIPLLKFISE